jgi:hypothetical protein
MVSGFSALVVLGFRVSGLEGGFDVIWCKVSVQLAIFDNVSYYQGVTCMHIAAEAGPQTLNPQTLNQGITCMHIAAEAGHLRVVQLLAKEGGSQLCNAVDFEGRTCAMWAASRGHVSVLQVRFWTYLIVCGCFINACNKTPNITRTLNQVLIDCDHEP